MKREYQEWSREEFKRIWGSGTQAILYWLATGGGKTHVFSDVMNLTQAAGNKVIMVVRGRQLVDQASKRLFHEGVNHGVKMANHWNVNHSALTQICSIDTLLSRGEYPDCKLLVIDEAHLFTSEKCVEFVKHYRKSGAFILAVTATPWSKESLTHLADTVVHPITMTQLIEQGYLVPPVYYAPSTPDLKGVKTVNNDYDNKQLEVRMDALTGDIPAHWMRLSSDRPTLGFAVNINHSKHLTEQFNQLGIPAEHIEGMTTFKEREAAFARLARGDSKVLFNVGVACTGVDLPFCSSILMARPTKSYPLYIQIAGRGTRTFCGKENFLLLDHAGNVLRHGFITDEPEVDLDAKKFQKGGLTPKVCEKCFAIYTGMMCHACNYSPPSVESSVEVAVGEGVLEELKGLPDAVLMTIQINRIKETARKHGHKYGWIWERVKEKYGVEIANRVFPTQAKRSNPKSPWFVRSTRRRMLA